MTAAIIYKKAPLIELIVEAHWAVPALIAAPGAPAFVSDASPLFDDWFMALRVKLSQLGYTDLERLVAHDMPPMANKPMFRLRKPGQPFPVVHFGHGVFTVNAGPPGYTNWDSFRPHVEQCLQALVESKPSAPNAPAHMFAVSMRYIDAFSSDLREGKSNFAFLRDDLGISLTLPDSLLGMASSEDAIAPNYVVRIPLKERPHATLTLSVGEGLIGTKGEQSKDTIMDMAYAARSPMAFSVDAVLSELDYGQNVVHRWFGIITSRIHDRMQPNEQ